MLFQAYDVRIHTLLVTKFDREELASIGESQKTGEEEEGVDEVGIVQLCPREVQPVPICWRKLKTLTSAECILENKNEAETGNRFPCL